MTRYYDEGRPDFEIQGQPTASPEAQVKFLRALLRLKDEKILSLEAELDSVRLNREVEDKVLIRQLNTLSDVQKRLQASVPLAPKKPWWKL